MPREKLHKVADNSIEVTGAGHGRNHLMFGGSMTQIDLPTEFAYRIRSPAAVRQNRRSGSASESKIGSYRIAKRGRLWELRDAAGDLVCLTAYKKGAAEVARRLSALSSLDAALPQ